MAFAFNAIRESERRAAWILIFGTGTEENLNRDSRDGTMSVPHNKLTTTKAGGDVYRSLSGFFCFRRGS